VAELAEDADGPGDAPHSAAGSSGARSPHFFPGRKDVPFGLPERVLAALSSPPHLRLLHFAGMEARRSSACRPVRLRMLLGRVFVGRTEGNRWLSATTTAVPLVLLSAEGATLLALRGGTT
jgi:hypothetical protein